MGTQDTKIKNGSLEGQHIGFFREESEKHLLEIIKDTSLALHNGEFKTIIGPSGCGKTTLLSILSGLLCPDSGTVLLNGIEMGEITKRVGLPTPSDVGVVFQDYGLFPWRTVEKNVSFGLEMVKTPKEIITQKVADILSRVGLTEFTKHYPHQLSGGMKQRTSIARVLATDAEFLLMDEPFSALDFQTRYFMQEFLLEVWKKFDKTIIYVTHHMDEAIMLSDTIYLMTARPGKIIEEMKIDLPRPRSITDPKFVEYRNHIALHLEREVKKIFELQ
ncbi:MAG: ABC transporter ATP-binding protein [Candidatus Taylorbacteria bacterium]|nr:ABC transporter ATP-binding protein [Candidatus Taylorbacteria bacterium]